MKALVIILFLIGFFFLILKKKTNTEDSSILDVNKEPNPSQQSKESPTAIEPKQEETEPYEWKDYNLTTQEEFKEAFITEGLGDKWQYFKTQLRPEIRIKPKHVEEDLLDIGQSKIGGNPDLPSDVNWPIQKNGKKLAFLAQLNFDEFTSDFPNLPNSGILYFFYDEAQEFWGDSKENSDSFRSIFIENPSNLERRTAPDDFVVLKGGMYRPCKLKFTNSYSLPNWEHDYVSEQFKDTNNEPYIDISSSGQYITKLFGHSINVQGTMEYECEMVDRGYSWNDIPENEKPIISKESNKWNLLFQLDSEDEAKMMWGDVGRLYFWIKKEDLEKHNFDKTWMMFQCH